MSLKTLNIHRFIKSKKTESEIANSLKEYSYKNLEIGNNEIRISGMVFYDFFCDLNDSKVKLTAKPKKNILISVLIFFIIWTIGFTYEHGILFGLSTALFGILLFGIVNKRLMELSLDEISELIKK